MILFMSKKIVFNKNGSTLLEAVIGGMMIAIASLMIVTGFVAALNFIKQSTIIKDKGLQASSVLEGAVNTDPNITKTTNPNGSFSFQIDSIQYEITGSFISASDNTTSVGFVIFEADSK